MEKVIEIPIEKIRPNPWNVNFLLAHERVKLRDAMAKYGSRVVPPILVREKNGNYEIIDGEQRWRIARELSWKTIPALIRNLLDDEVMRLCLSYNILRGRADWFKLAEIMAEQEKKGANLTLIYTGILSPDEVHIILALNNFDRKARKILRKLHKETGILMPEHLAIIVKFPKERHIELAEGLYSLKGAGENDLKDLLSDYLNKSAKEEEAETEETLDSPEETSKKKATEYVKKTGEKKKTSTKEHGAPKEKGDIISEKERKDISEKEKVEEEEVETEKVESEEPEKIIEKVDKKAVFFVCECGVQYRIDFEKRTVERVKKERGMDVFQIETTLPASIVVECPCCGAKGTIDVGGEEVEWSLK